MCSTGLQARLFYYNIKRRKRVRPQPYHVSTREGWNELSPSLTAKLGTFPFIYLFSSDKNLQVIIIFTFTVSLGLVFFKIAESKMKLQPDSSIDHV